MIRFQDFCLDEERRQLKRSTELLHLPPKAFDLLLLLVRERPRVISQAVIHDTLWPNTFVGPGSLHNLVSQLREALGDEPHEIIRTAYGTGFSFAASVLVDDPNLPSLCRITIGDVEFDLRDGENIVGRDWDARVRIDSPSISRHHARILIAGGTAKIDDLGSKNGTWVNGRRLRATLPLASGDRVLLGTVAATFTVLAPPGSTTTVVS